MMEKTLQDQDVILRAIESALYILAGNKNLPDISLTRWRWDQPEVMLVWLQGQIYRNIVANVYPSNVGYLVSVAANMWIDCDVGSKRERLWVPFKNKVELEVNSLSDEDLNKLKGNLLVEVAEEFGKLFDNGKLTKQEFEDGFKGDIKPVKL